MSEGTGAGATLWMPEQISSGAVEADFAWNVVLWVATVLFALVMGAMIYLVWRYRRRPGHGPASAAEAPDHSGKVELLWTAAPTLIVIVLFFVGFRGFLGLSVAPAEAAEINVTAERWLWTFSYPEGMTSVNELRVPVGKPVKLVMSSKDVIHSFFVPELRVKRDVLPGRYTTVWFEPTKTGEWDLLCTEYCGTGHSAMLAKLVVQEPKAYDEWLQSGGQEEGVPAAEQGKRLFSKMACNTCHTIDGAASTGPTLKGLFGHEVKLANGERVEADENYLRESITNPAGKVVQGYQPVMPVFKGLLNQAQLDALIAYVKSLSGEGGEGGKKGEGQ